jgi:hypothetical protein
MRFGISVDSGAASDGPSFGSSWDFNCAETSGHLAEPRHNLGGSVGRVMVATDYWWYGGVAVHYIWVAYWTEPLVNVPLFPIIS